MWHYLIDWLGHHSLCPCALVGRCLDEPRDCAVCGGPCADFDYSER